MGPLPQFDKWDEIYRKYIDIPYHKPIFQAEGFSEGDVNLQQSQHYKKHFKFGNVTYLGRVNRRRGKPNIPVQNKSFVDFLSKRKLNLNFNYNVIVKNVNAEYQSASKYDKTQPILDEAAWALAGEWTKRHFGPGKMRGASIVSQEIAWQEMDKQTSPGYPHNLKYSTKSKMAQDKQHMSIIEDYWEMIKKTQQEQEWKPIWSCSEKVELRPIDKIALNKIRTFTASPVEHSVALNRLCLDMNNRFYASNGKTWSFVGGNKFMCGFDELHKRLSKHNNAYELDESEFDSSLFARAMYEQADIRFDFLAEEHKTVENKNIMFNLYESIIHSVITMQNGELLQKHTGNPSGSANTIVDNTMILFRLFAYAWIVLVKQTYGEENAQKKHDANNTDVTKRAYSETFGHYSDFMQEVEAALNGDDNSFTCSDKVDVFFNPKTIAPIWSGIGITTNTPCDKSGKKVEEIRFLSQGFTRIGTKWLPTPETNKVLSSIMYNSEIDDPMWHYMRACALRVDTWANKECRTIIQMYIEYIEMEYNNLFNSQIEVGPNDAKLKMSDIRNMYKTDNWIYKLYTNKEMSPQLTESVGQTEEFEFQKTFHIIKLATCLEDKQLQENNTEDLQNLKGVQNPLAQ